MKYYFQVDKYRIIYICIFNLLVEKDIIKIKISIGGFILKRVSDLAQQYGILPSQIRYYIKEGLLFPTDRTPGGHFLFDEEQEQRLQRIFELKEKRYRIKEIREILSESSSSGN